MSVQASELKMYKAQTNLDGPSNGGRLSAVEVVSGLSANLFPRVTNSERVAGVTRHRKAFHKVDNPDNINFEIARIFLENYTAGDDRLQMFIGTQTDTENDITGSEDKYAVGALNADVIAGATTLDIAVETGAGAESLFKNGQTIRISDKDDIDAAGNEQIVTINSAPSVVGDIVTITFTPALSVGFTTANNTRIASMIEAGTVTATFDNFVVTSTLGAYDEVTNPVVVDFIAGIEQVWTLTFTSATAFDIVGDTVGNVGTGNTTSGAAPTNTDHARPYFTLASAGFSGTFAIGETIVFHTHPACVPVWYKQVVPAGAASIANNKAITVFEGESSS